MSLYIPGFDLILGSIHEYDPALVASWGEVANWVECVVSAIAVWAMYLAFRLVNGKSSVVRGAQLLSYEQMTRLIRRAGTPKVPLLIGQYSIPAELETRSLAIIGEPGTGKTQLLLQYIQSKFSRGEKICCVDVGGNIYRMLGKAEDVVVSPTFENSEAWSPFSEIRTMADCKALASMMIDKNEGESGAWDQKAIDYTSDLLCYCVKNRLTRNRDLIHLVRFAARGELEQVFEGSSSMKLFESGSEKMLSNIQAIVSQNLAFLDLLDPNSGRDAFSIRTWVRTRDRNLWIINDEGSKDVTQPIRRVAIGLLIRESLELGEDRDRRINVVLDELTANGKVPALQNAIAQGRKYGLNFQLGFQSLALMYSIYSRDETHAILGSAGHTVVLRTPDFETAEYYSRAVGDSVTEREQVSVSRPNGLTTRQRLRETQRAVMPTEIQNFKDLNGIVKIAGIAWAKIRIPIVKAEMKNDLTPKCALDHGDNVVTSVKINKRLDDI